VTAAVGDPKADAVRECLLFTRWAIVDLDPTSLERVASLLDALRSREPMKSGRGWDNERQVLGCLVTDLRSMVLAAGEPVGVQRDLRDARTRQDEVSARARADGAIRAYDALITDAIETDRRSDAFHRGDPGRPVPAEPEAAGPLPML
jgi:hypothetical protein